MPPLVSIVVTNYNYGRFLGRAIESALGQTHPRTEVVVVDDASTDESPDVIRGFGDRVRPVLCRQNGGQGAGFNRGFEASRGDVILFLDADDWLYPQAAARVAAAFAPGTAKVQFRLHLVDANGRLMDLFPAPEVAFDDGDVVPLLLARGRYQTTVTSGNAFARSTLAAILPVPEEEFRLAADGYLVTIAPLTGRVASIEEPLGAYVQHGDNNWAITPLGLGGTCRRQLLHDFSRFRALRRQAAERGLGVPDDVGIHDPLHLSYRIGSLVGDPLNHPVPTDRRPRLAVLGARASRNARLPTMRRLVLAVWFLAAGLLPRRMAVSLIVLFMAPEARPPRLRRWLRRFRTWLR